MDLGNRPCIVLSKLEVRQDCLGTRQEEGTAAFHASADVRPREEDGKFVACGQEVSTGL